MKPILVFDLDHTLLHTGERIQRFIRDVTGQDMSVEMICKTYAVEKLIEDEGYIRQVVDLINASEPVYDHPLAPFDGAPEGVRRLIDAGWGVEYVTARPGGQMEATCWEMRQAGFPVPNDSLHHACSLSDDSRHDWNQKPEIMRELQAHGSIACVIGDRPSDVASAEEIGAPSVLVDTTLPGDRLAKISESAQVPIRSANNWVDIERAIHEVAAFRPVVHAGKAAI